MSPAPSCVETKMFLNPKDVLNLPFVVAVVKYLRLLLNIFALSSPEIFSLDGGSINQELGQLCLE